MLSLEGMDLKGVRWCLIQAIMDFWDVALTMPHTPPWGSLREAFPECKVLSSIVCADTHHSGPWQLWPWWGIPDRRSSDH